MKIFIDTGVFIALFVSSEKYHQQTAGKYKSYRKQRVSFFTSFFVLDELFTRLIYDFGHYKTQKVIDLLEKSIQKEELTVLDVDKTTFKKAGGALLKFADHKISFTDATSYVLYKDFGMDEIFTLDSDFKKIGAQTSFRSLL